MKKYLLRQLQACCLCMSFMTSLYAQIEFKEFYAQATPQKRIAVADKKILQYQSFRLPVAEISSFVKSKSKSSFRLNFKDDVQWDIELEPSTLVSLDYKRTIVTPAGKRSEVFRPDFLFKGRSLNSGGGYVRLAIKDNFIYGVVTVDNKEFVLEPASRYGEASSNEYLLYASDDVIADTALKCGFEGKSGNIDLYNEQVSITKKQQGEDNDSVGRLIQILQVTDYEMLKEYDFNIDSLETFLFANLNISEAIFNSFNFNTDIDADTGKNSISFKIIETVISTCESCDILDKSGKLPKLLNAAKSWVQNNYSQKKSLFYQFWSPRRIFSGEVEALGITTFFSNPDFGACSYGSFNFLKYYTPDPIGLRYLTVHELGHSLGADHDNGIVPGMKSFFMTSYPVLSATRFSRATDFEAFTGYEHLADQSSNNRIRNLIMSRDSCYKLYENNITPCKLSAPPHITYFNVPDSVKVSWQGNGNYIVKLMQRDNSTFFTLDSFFTNASSTVFKNLEPCMNYKVEVKQVCGSDSSLRSEAIIVTNTQLMIEEKKIINENADKHDLQLKISHNHNKTGLFYILIDHIPTGFSFSDSPQTIVIKNLFSDGANHRIDIRQFLDEGYCNNTYSYQAPYFRNKSKKILLNDFNESCTQGSWETKILRPDTSGTPVLAGVFENNNDLLFEMGNFDSTCYWRYNSWGYSDRKTIAFTSPYFDASQYYDVELSFDYQYWVNPASPVIDSAYVSAEVFDGDRWHTVFKKNRSDIFGPKRIYDGIQVWDTLPPRFFASLDSFRSQVMQIRFIAELGTNDSISGNPMFLALDNIRVDGYSLQELNEPLIYKAFPNPVQNEIFLNFSRPILTLPDFRIIDMSGKVVNRGKIRNDKISTNGLQSGIYILQVFDAGKLIGKPFKFYKHF